VNNQQQDIEVQGRLRCGWYSYELETDQGSWRIDIGRRLDHLIGREIRVRGDRFGPTHAPLLDVQVLEPAIDYPEKGGMLGRMIRWLRRASSAIRRE